MVILILPHKGEAALADSRIQYVGSFEPTGFSRWWFSSLGRNRLVVDTMIDCDPSEGY